MIETFLYKRVTFINHMVAFESFSNSW